MLELYCPVCREELEPDFIMDGVEVLDVSLPHGGCSVAPYVIRALEETYGDRLIQEKEEEVVVDRSMARRGDISRVKVPRG